MNVLREIAFARSGDKGDSANIAVFARSPEAYRWLQDNLSTAVVERFLQPLGIGQVRRFEVPNLEALNFVVAHALGGGGSRSLRIDAQGKTLGMALLELPVDLPPTLRRDSGSSASRLAPNAPPPRSDLHT